MVTSKYFLLFLPICIVSFFPTKIEASSCLLSETVNASSSPCSTPVDTILVTGTLTMDANLTYGYDVTLIIDGGNINWTSNVDLTLTSNSILLIINGGIIGPTSGGGCNAQKTVTFGSTVIASCNGGGNGITNDFTDIINAGGVNVSGPLPVNLITFEGIRQQDNNILLKWSTAQEINNSHFNLECFINDSFRTIATIPGAGNSQQIKEYSFRDDNAKNCTLYYRLKQVDFDNKFEYSKIIMVPLLLEVKNELKVYPNPINRGDKLHLSCDLKTKLKYRVLMKSGLEVCSGIVNQKNKIIPIKNIPKGDIFIELSDGKNKLFYKKVIIL